MSLYVTRLLELYNSMALWFASTMQSTIQPFIISYGYEIVRCHPPTDTKLMLHGIIALEKFLVLVGGKLPNHYCFTAILCLHRFSLIKGK